MSNDELFYLQKDNIFAVPVLHYNMEMAAQVRLVFEHLKPDCVAVELAETMQLQLLHAASRLPDISVVVTYDRSHQPLYYLCEPCDAAFEALRSALESNISAFCIDLDVDYYPEIREHVPDPYSIQRIGLRSYYESYEKGVSSIEGFKTAQDHARELHMARRLKELSLSYDKVLFIGGMAHTRSILNFVSRTHFPTSHHAHRDIIELCTLTPESCRDVLAECGWFSKHYNEARGDPKAFPPDRQKLIFSLYKEAIEPYWDNTGNPFPGYNLRNIMKFVRNYALISGQLMPDLFQILSAAKACVDHNYAYATWYLATDYPYCRNIEGLPELDLTIEDIWKHTKLLRFHLKHPGRKEFIFKERPKDKAKFRFQPPGPFSICSYPPQDLIVERFGNFLKKKGTQILTEESARTIPLSTSLEDGIDIKETLRHWYEKKLFVKVHGKPPGNVGSVVVIFDEDAPNEEEKNFEERFPWRTTWLGEHQQESDMAFYATPLSANVVGPGISRCEYGGFMMSYPPRRMFDIWNDSDYAECRTKAEVLLMAAIDYAKQPVVVYVASKPPRSAMKSFAQRFGKKVVYIPIGQLSPVTLNKIRVFHVLDGHNKRASADEYIF